MTLATVMPPAEMLIRQSPHCAWLLNRDQTFHAAFGDAARVFGRPDHELAGVCFTDLLDPEIRPPWIRQLERVFQGESVRASCRLAGGTFSVTMFPVQAPGKGVVFAGCMAHEERERGALLRTLESLESERARLGQILHDHVGQNLSAVGLQLDLLRMDLAENSVPAPTRVDQIQEMLETLIGLVRDVNRDLDVAPADRIGLRAALDALAGRLRGSFKGNVRVFADATAPPPPPKIAAALYRIAQEAAGSAARREGCSAIEILVKSLRSGTALEVRDNAATGDGAGSPFESGALDLLVMQHFAEAAGIELQIESVPEKGTMVRALCRSAGN